MTQRIHAFQRLGVAAFAALLLTACGGPKPHAIVVGAVDDAPGAAPLARNAGYKALVFSSVWTPGETDGASPQLRAAVVSAVSNGIRPIVAVYSFSGVTPLTDTARAQFASFAASIPRALPVRNVIVGNEPNLNLFWMPQFAPDGSDAAAQAYFTLLAQTYDAIKALDPNVNVIGGALAARGSDKPNGSRPTHSPTQFIADLGAAYHASGRTRPLFDMFSIHPYPENSSTPPDFQHPHTTSVGLADYGKLTSALAAAFGKAPPLVYGEYGVQTAIAPSEAGAYSGSEQATTKPVDPATQGADYVEAMQLATCQPLVRMLLFFHVVDEPQLEGLQTGVYYADGHPKPDLGQVAGAAKSAESGKLKCR
jgi:hypothetical protein